jgi:hypothetical protein
MRSLLYKTEYANTAHAGDQRNQLRLAYRATSRTTPCTLALTPPSMKLRGMRELQIT